MKSKLSLLLHSTFPKEYILILLGIIASSSIFSQSNYRLSVSISVGHHVTDNLKYNENAYIINSNAPMVDIISHNSYRLNSYNFGLGFRLGKNTKIKTTIGSMRYGINYKANVSPSIFTGPLPFTVIEDQVFLYLEVGTSINQIIKMADGVNFFIEPGILWYTNSTRDFRRQLQFFQNSNSFSAMLFTGVSLPLIGDNIFINIGGQLKVPLNNFASSYNYVNYYYPVSIGVLAQFTFKF